MGGQYLRASSAERKAAGVCRRATVRCRAAGVVGQCDGSDRPGRLRKDAVSIRVKMGMAMGNKVSKGRSGRVGGGRTAWAA